jgi:hypothetical protein
VVLDRYGYRPLPSRIPEAEMDILLSQMLATERELLLRTYDLDTNCLGRDDRQAPEYVLRDDVTEAKTAFYALRGAAEKKYGKLLDLPR